MSEELVRVMYYQAGCLFHIFYSMSGKLANVITVDSRSSIIYNMEEEEQKIKQNDENTRSQERNKGISRS